MSPPTTTAHVLPLSQTLSAKHPGDAAALAEALAGCRAEHAAFVYWATPVVGAFRVEAATQKALAEHIARAVAAAGFPLDVGPVTIQPCWTPARLAEAEHRIGTADGGSDEFAVVRLRVVPRRPGEGNLFETEFAGPPEIDALNAAVARGVAQVWAEGIEGAGRLIDTRVVFIDGAFHPKRSTLEGFEQAAIIAMHTACRTAGLKRLEPIMEVDILAERDLVLPVVNDLAQRGGHEVRRRLAPRGVVIAAELPLRILLTYEADLASLSKGRAKYVGEPQLVRWTDAPRR